MSGTRARDCAVVAGILAGVADASPAPAAETPDDDPAQFALALAEKLLDDASAGHRGNLIVLLEPTADVTEIALVMEHIFTSRVPTEPIGIRDVVAVTSVREIVQVLLSPAEPDGASSDTLLAEFRRPGQLASRLEFASVIVLTDLGSDATSSETVLVRALLSRMAPRARVVPLEGLAGSRTLAPSPTRGRAHQLGASMGWQLALAENAVPQAARHGVGSVVFRDPRPFHPGRLHDAVISQLTPARVGHIVRSRGFVQLASRPGRVGSWSIAGDILDLDPTTMSSWDPESPTGQEIVFFGIDLREDALHAALSACLLTDEELLAGVSSWARYADAFPEWVTHLH